MRADEASNTNEREHPFGYHGQNTAIIAELTGKIKGHTRLPVLLWPTRLTRIQPAVALPAVFPPCRSQAKASTNALPQGAFILDTDQCLETFPGHI
jgi:hypothetical protein